MCQGSNQTKKVQFGDENDLQIEINEIDKVKE